MKAFDIGSMKIQLLIWYNDPVQFFRDLYEQEPYAYQARALRDIPSLRRVMMLAAGGCLLEGTKISMANGTYKKIEDVKSGDMLLSFDDNNTVPNKAMELIDSGYKEVFELTNKLGVKLYGTKDHPILRRSGWQDLLKFKKLHNNDKAYFFNNITKQITEERFWVTKSIGIQHVYDISMKDHSNFIAEGLVVHNTGKTKLLACLALWFAVVYSSIKKKAYSVLIVAGSQEQSTALYQFSAEKIYDHPILSKLVKGEILKTITRFKMGSEVRAVPLSLKSLQGKHYPCVIVDEAALVDDFTIADTYRIVGGNKEDSKIILCGTPTIYSSLYVAMWEDKKTYPTRSKAKEPTPLMWERLSWSAIESSRFSHEEIEEARQRLSEEDFKKFWMGEPYPLTNTVVDIAKIRKASIGYERFKYNPKRKMGKIIFGVDWGMTDYTVLVIAQVVDDDEADSKVFYKIIDVQEWRGEEYDDVHLWIGAFADIYKPEFIFVDLNPKGESNRCVNKLMPKGYFVKPVNMSQERSRLQTRMRYIFEHENIILPQDFQATLNEIKLYTWDKTKHDDRVTALMLALTNLDEDSFDQSFYVRRGSMHNKRSPFR